MEFRVGVGEWCERFRGQGLGVRGQELEFRVGVGVEAGVRGQGLGVSEAF